MAQPPHLCPHCRHANRAIARFCAWCGHSLLLAVQAQAHTSEPLPIGTRFGPGGRYQVQHLLGRGGFGEAYLAHDAGLDRLCVIKRFAPREPLTGDARALLQQAFTREARLLVTLNQPGHPAIPEIYEYLPEEQALVMKYITGRSFAAELARRAGGLPEHEALVVIREVCRALVYLHEHTPEPVLHRDVKPANILRGDDGRIWLIDFGLAKGLPVTLSDEASFSQTAGTFGFTPTEQWQGRAEARSDVFALAATLAILLTNQPQTALMSGPFAVRLYAPDVRPATADLVMRGMSYDLAARPTAREFLAELDRLLIADHVAPPPPPRLPQRPTMVGREAELAMLAASLANSDLTVIAGLPGVGKTTVATALALRGAARASNADVFWYSFQPGEGVEALIWALAGFLAWHGHDDLWRLLHTAHQRGSDLPSPEVLVDAALTLVRGRRYLLCLDDAQYAADDRLLARLAAGLRQARQAGGAVLIITSRSVPEFAQPGDTVVTLGGLAVPAARQFLAGHNIQLADPQFDALYQATEGNPQLLLLATEALRQSTDPVGLITRLAEAPNIERYLLREVDLHLSVVERDVMIAVAVFQGRGATRAGVEAVLAGQRVRRELSDLAQRRLLTTQGDTDPTYTQHAIVQAFYYADPPPVRCRELHRRAGAFYATHHQPLLAAIHYERAEEYAEAASLATSNLWQAVNAGQAQLLEQLLAQLSAQNLESKARVAVLLARGEVADVLRNPATTEESFRAALTQVQALPTSGENRRLQARACRGMGNLQRFEAPIEAQEWYRQGIAALDDTEPRDIAILQVGLGATLFASGAFLEAQQVLEQSLNLLSDNEEHWRANALVNLGIVYCEQNQCEQGVSSYRQALILYQRSADIYGQITVWHNLGIEAQIGGDWDEAITHYRQVIVLTERLGLEADRAESELALGILHTNRGDYEVAATHLLTAVELARRYELREQLADALLSNADLELRQGDVEAAFQLWSEAAQLVEQLNTRSQLAEVLLVQATIELTRRRSAEAVRVAEQAIVVAAELNQARDEGTGLRLLGQALRANNRNVAAIPALERSLELLEDLDPYEAARTQTQLGLALRATGDEARASTLLRTAGTTFTQLGANVDQATVVRALEEGSKCALHHG